jgi:hypothetical protein
VTGWGGGDQLWGSWLPVAVDSASSIQGRLGRGSKRKFHRVVREVADTVPGLRSIHQPRRAVTGRHRVS